LKNETLRKAVDFAKAKMYGPRPAQDCCDREAISWAATNRGVDAVLVKDMLVAAIEKRFGQVFCAPKPLEFLTDKTARVLLPRKCVLLPRV
jgi:transposase InsO family protein